MRTRGHRAVVTGTSSGIGRAVALAFCDAGWNVTATLRTREDAERLQADAHGTEGELRTVLLDITEAHELPTLASGLADGLDVLVNVAGAVYPGPLELVGVAALRRQLEVNVVGQLALTIALLPALRARSGRVVFVSSAAGRLPLPLNGAYSASKHALEAAADALRVEVAPFGVEVVVVEPGNVRTRIWETTAARVEALDDPTGVYAAQLAHVRKAFRARGRGLAPARVAQVILKAATTARPRARYRVGADARVAALARHLPDRLRDFVWRVRYRL